MRGSAGVAGSFNGSAVLSALRHSQTSEPLRITSVSPSVPSSASRTLSSPGVPDPGGVAAGDELRQVRRALAAGDARPARGSPRSARLHHGAGETGEPAFCRSTSNWAALRSGSDGSALATIVPAAAPPPMTTTAAAAGTSQRSAGLDLSTDTMSTSR